MDGSQKKRKKSKTGKLDGSERRPKKESTSATTTPPPTEEEVDEFFTILNRMRVTVKYLKNNKNINIIGDSIIPAIELPVLGASEVMMSEKEMVDVKAGDTCVLDLNSLPDVESTQSE